MVVFVISFIVIVLAILGMAVGALAGRGPLRGSCGGIANGDCKKTACGLCEHPADAGSVRSDLRVLNRL